MVALGALDIVALEEAGDLPVAPAGEVPGQAVAAAVVVVGHAGDAGELAVGPVEKHHGHSRLPQALVQVLVRRGQGRLGPLHQKAAHRLLNQPEQDLPLQPHMVSCGVDRRGVALSGKHVGGVVEDGGKDVVVHKGGHHRNLLGGSPRQKTRRVGAAALPAVDQPLLLQQAQGVANRLPAQLVALGQLLLRG